MNDGVTPGGRDGAFPGYVAGAWKTVWHWDTGGTPPLRGGARGDASGLSLHLSVAVSMAPHRFLHGRCCALDGARVIMLPIWCVRST